MEEKGTLNSISSWWWRRSCGHLMFPDIPRCSRVFCLVNLLEMRRQRCLSSFVMRLYILSHYLGEKELRNWRNLISLVGLKPCDGILSDEVEYKTNGLYAWTNVIIQVYGLHKIEVFDSGPVFPYFSHFIWFLIALVIKAFIKAPVWLCNSHFICFLSMIDRLILHIYLQLDSRFLQPFLLDWRSVALYFCVLHLKKVF